MSLPALLGRTSALATTLVASCMSTACAANTQIDTDTSLDDPLNFPRLQVSLNGLELDRNKRTIIKSLPTHKTYDAGESVGGDIYEKYDAIRFDSSEKRDGEWVDRYIFVLRNLTIRNTGTGCGFVSFDRQALKYKRSCTQPPQGKMEPSQSFPENNMISFPLNPNSEQTMHVPLGEFAEDCGSGELTGSLNILVGACDAASDSTSGDRFGRITIPLYVSIFWDGIIL